MHRRGVEDKLDATRYTLHPSSRTSIRSTSLNAVPLVMSSMRMAFSTRPESLKAWSEAVVQSQSDFSAAGRGMENGNRVGLHYTRRGKEFLVGVRGSRQDVENIKSRIADFLRTELHLEVDLASHMHIEAGTVEFLGTRIAGLLDRKARRRFSKEIEKRRRSKVRAQGEAHIRTEAWHNELKDLAVQAWAFGLKKTRRQLQSWETAEEVMYKRLQERDSKFVPEQIDRVVAKEALQRLLDKEEEVFADALGTGLPQPILRAHQRLTRLLKKHLEAEAVLEKKAEEFESRIPQPKNIPTKDGADDDDDDDDSIPLQLLAPMETIMEKLSIKGILQPSRALPTVLTPMLNSSDEAIVSYFTALGTCLLSYYRCCDNFEKIRRLVDHQVRWSALFTLGSKHGCSARKIIRQFSRGPRIMDQQGSVVEFPSSTDIARTGKKFLVHEQQHSLDDILRSRPYLLRPSSEDKKGPRGTVREV